MVDMLCTYEIKEQAYLDLISVDVFKRSNDYGSPSIEDSNKIVKYLVESGVESESGY